MTKRKRRHRRSVDVRIMWLQPHVDGFRSWLAQRSYSPATTVEVIRLLALWGDWVHAAGYDVDTLAAGLSVSASVFQGGKTARAPQGAARLFISYLREKDILPQEQPSSLEDTWPTLAAFRRWMKEQRGIKDSTLDTYQPVLIDLLALLGTAPEAYTAAAIRDFVLERAKPHGRGRAQGVTVATRAYLRYLVAIGQCPVGRNMRFRASPVGSWRQHRVSWRKLISNASLPSAMAKAGYATGPSSFCLSDWG